MSNYSKIVMALFCVTLTACDGDLVDDVTNFLSNEQTVHVYQDDQALSCSTEGIISIETHSELLVNENIEILCSQKGSDGLNYTQSCGSQTGSINVFTISDKDLSKAESLGFSNISDLPDAQYDDLCIANAIGISIEDFDQQVINAVGTEALYCGKVEINGSSLATNTCVSDSFVTNTPFYSFYVLQGIDSTVVKGISMNVDGVVEYWSFDSFGEEKISSQVCENPSATFILEGAYTDIFNCTE